MDRLLPVLVLAVVFLAALGLMVLGWRLRGRRQAGLPAPDSRSELADLGEGTEVGPVDAIYVDTVLADRPLERVVAHGLGARSTARVSRGDGGSWRILRRGAPSLTIPAAAVLDVASAPGMAGKFVGGDGLLVIRWRLGDQDLDTGLRLGARADHDLLLSRKEHP